MSHEILKDVEKTQPKWHIWRDFVISMVMVMAIFTAGVLAQKSSEKPCISGIHAFVENNGIPIQIESNTWALCWKKENGKLLPADCPFPGRKPVNQPVIKVN